MGDKTVLFILNKNNKYINKKNDIENIVLTILSMQYFLLKYLLSYIEIHLFSITESEGNNPYFFKLFNFSL